MSRFLISVQFERGFVPDTLDGKIERAQDFLFDLGLWARKNGKRLHATYSIVRGLIGYHAHFAVSWLPMYNGKHKKADIGDKAIGRKWIVELLERNYFYCDNLTEGIKVITHNRKYVTEYVIQQPKDGQSTIFSEFYIYQNFVPVHSEVKIHPYCSKPQFCTIRLSSKNEPISRQELLSLISLVSLIMISYFLLSLF